MNESIILKAAKDRLLEITLDGTPAGKKIVDPAMIVLPQEKFAPPTGNLKFLFIEISVAENDNWASTDGDRRFEATINFIICVPKNSGVDRINHIANIIEQNFAMTVSPETYSAAYLKIGTDRYCRVTERQQIWLEDDVNYSRKNVRIIIEGTDD